MKMFGLFALALTVLSFLLWIAGWVYWNFVYTIGEFWSTTYTLMLGVGLLAGVCGFLAVVCVAIGLIVGAKKSANG